MLTLVLAVLAAGPSAGVTHFDVTASFAAQGARRGEVSVTFRPKDPDVKVNQHPAPRLAVEGGLLAVPPAPSAAGARAPREGEDAYLDTALPVVFPVSVAEGARGTQVVKASVTYFYCSKRDGWCKKGTTPVEFPVSLK